MFPGASHKATAAPKPLVRSRSDADRLFYSPRSPSMDNLSMTSTGRVPVEREEWELSRKFGSMRVLPTAGKAHLDSRRIATGKRRGPKPVKPPVVPSTMPKDAKASADPASQHVTFTIYGKSRAVTSDAKRQLEHVLEKAYKEVVISSTECHTLLFLPYLSSSFVQQLPQWCTRLTHVLYGKSQSLLFPNTRAIW